MLCHLLIRGTGEGKSLILLCIVGTFIGHDGHRTIFAEQQPIEVSTYETGLPLHVCALTLCEFVVLVDIVDEHRRLVNASVGVDPEILIEILVIVTLLEGGVLAGIVEVVAEFVVAVTPQDVVGEHMVVTAVCLLYAHVAEVVLEKVESACEPSICLVDIGKYRFKCHAVIEIFVGIKRILAGGEHCRRASDKRSQ